MRILNLELERYGPFTARSLAFRPDAKLHVVFGNNEAGKSSALAGITDLLFGIEAKTEFNFLHEYSKLRLGATITNKDGRQLAFRRSKGIKNTLRDAADLPLPDNILAPFLGNLSREVFCHAFGLNSDGLQLGAREMLANKGEVGVSLLAAASGLSRLTELRRNLDEEADKIFASRASKDRLFTQAEERFASANSAIKVLGLRAADWKALTESIEKYATQLAEIQKRQADITIERSKLSRLKRVAPLLGLINKDLADLGTLGELPQVSKGFATRLESCVDELKRAEADQAITVQDEAVARKQHDDIIVDQTILRHAVTIPTMFKNVGAYAKVRLDLPRIRAERDGACSRLGKLAVQLGLDASAVESRQPSNAAQALVRSLIKDGQAVRATVKSVADSLGKEKSKFDKLIEKREESGGIVDVRILQQRLKDLRPELKQLEKRVEIDSRINVETTALHAEALRLFPPILDLEAFALASLPAAETIDRFREQFDGLTDQIRREEERVSNSKTAQIQILSKLEALTSGRPVPTREAISIGRLQRDEQWHILRSTLFGARDALEEGMLSEGVSQFERLSLEADRLADDAGSDAERIAAHSAYNLKLKEERIVETASSSLLQSLTMKLDTVEADWQRAWTSAQISPLPHREMVGWLRATKELIKQRLNIAIAVEELSTLNAKAIKIAPLLNGLAVGVGFLEYEGLDANLLADTIESRLQAIGEIWDKARDLDTGIRDCQTRIKDLSGEEAEALGQRADWLEQWGAAVLVIGLPRSATPDEAEAALASWSEVPPTIAERDDRERRVAGIERDMTKYEAEAASLIASLDEELQNLPTDVAIEQLNKRLTAATVLQSSKMEASKRLVNSEQAKVATAQSVFVAGKSLAALTSELPPELPPSNFLHQFNERAKLLAALEQKRVQWISQSDGHSEQSLQLELQSFDSDSAEAQLQSLEAEDKRLGNEEKNAYAEHDRAKRELASKEQGIGAEVAIQQRRNAEAELVTVSREWAVLKLGSLLLGTVVDQHRVKQQDPLINRASQLFETLTGGAFSGIGQSVNASDVLELVGKRPSGDTVSIDGMSDGTRDQLYLALRLAYLEDYSSRTEPAPFIADDILTTFDDQRTGHALVALAAIGDRVQPILFTHHRRVVEIALTKIGEAVHVIEL